MRLDPKLVHSSIFEATDAIVAKMGSGDAEANKALNAHFPVWAQTYGVGCAGYCVVATLPFLATIFAQRHLGSPWTGIAVLASFLLFFAIMGAAYMRNRRQLTVAELESLLPGLDLTETQRAYAEMVVTLSEQGQPAAETMTALNALLDEERRLVETRHRLTGSDVANERETLTSERERLAARAAGARDAVARDALEQSLALLDERRAIFDLQGDHLERIEAHLELLRQAVLSTRDAARRLGGAPVATAPDLATDTLRAAVANARAQTQATEQALAELRAI